MRQYPQLDKKDLQVTLGDLLNWSYWPIFIKIYCMCALLHCMVHECILNFSSGEFKAQRRPTTQMPSGLHSCLYTAGGDFPPASEWIHQNFRFKNDRQTPSTNETAVKICHCTAYG